eukprot:5608249-Ditylum_brightwellii.AAC.1
MHRAYCVKPTEEWRSICLHGVSAQLSHKTLESFANHRLVKTCHYAESYSDRTASITLFSSKFFTIDRDLADVIPPNNRTSAFTIGAVTSSPRQSSKNKKPLHHISTLNITPHEASMAFEKTNQHEGDNPNDLIGHRGS